MRKKMAHTPIPGKWGEGGELYNVKALKRYNQDGKAVVGTRSTAPLNLQRRNRDAGERVPTGANEVD